MAAIVNFVSSKDSGSGVVKPELPNQDLGVIIPNPKYRKVAYAVYAGVSLVVTNVAVAYTALQLPFDSWLVVAMAVLGNLAVPFGTLAIANATTKKEDNAG